jgi:hypothetical protein
MFNWKDISMAGIIILAIIFYTYKKHEYLGKFEIKNIKVSKRVFKLNHVNDSTQVHHIDIHKNNDKLSI